MANTFVKIQTVTVSTAVASITFSSIPQTFTDLKIVLCARSSRASNLEDAVNISFNTLTTNFSGRILYGSGSAAASTTTTRYASNIPATTATASVFGNSEIYIPNYTSANHKSFSADSVGENNATEAYIILIAGLWSDTAAITSIGLTSLNSANFVQYSTATLYGIKNT